MKVGKFARYKSLKHRGFTLVEILLAIAMSSIVVSAAGYAIVFVSKKNQVSELQSVRRIELNRALDFIADDVREASSVRGNEDSPADTRLQIIKADNSVVEYYYDPVASSDVWSGPGVIRRKEGDSPAEVLVDGIASDISSLSGTGCSGDDNLIAIPNTGFVVCINSAFRTADLALYGRLNVEDKASLSEEDFLIVATKFVTRNAPPPQRCIIPDLVGKTKTEAQDLWDTAGFINNLNLIGTDDEIAIQGLPANSVQDCSNTTMDAGDDDDICTVPNYDNGSTTISSAYSNWNSSDFTGSFTANGFEIDSSTDLSTINRTIESQALSPQPFQNNGTEVICTASIKVTEETCTVPDVTGKLELLAIAELTAAGFTNIDKEVRAGIINFTVDYQSPTAGETIFCSAPVTIGEPKCTVPEFRGTNSDNRATLWSSAQFTGTLTYTGPANTNLTWQSIAPGTIEFCDADIEVKPAATCTIDPDLLVGQNVSTAQSNWSSAGFYADTFDSTEVASGANIAGFEFRDPISGDVMTETLNADGEYEIDCGTLIKVDDQVCTVPIMERTGVADPAKISLSTARTRWTGAGFPAGNLIEEKFLSTTDVVNAQSIAAGTDLICSSSVTITGTGCVVPDLVGKTASTVQSIWTGAGFTTTLGSSLTGWHNGSTLNVSNNLSSTSWNTFTTFGQTPTRGDLRACTATGTVSNNAPTNVTASLTSANASNNVTEYTVNITWDFSLSAGRYYVFTCESNNKNQTCNPTVNRSDIENSTSIVRFNGNPIFTDKQATHIFTTSSTNKQRCYTVVARNISGDSLTPQSIVTTTPKSCIVY
ncbi:MULTISPECIES: prepilin-type N-terminal cleavage/methylation domain-containing protein [Cyanophyceae]|uniref:prepilin-type N-terminal cleavage/methylation domain-containing protein n=1 Tax=Cyanophyceae TaxID=3028117 RepID=UPI00016DCA15|nr:MULTISPECIES: prepilin-type N-terminal cleavage/methylation domain-containing protein [Cyanophyceae]ACA99593.1 conserved hypothetical protein [Picosynechococcus sp. PCC 7002]SMH29338.1 prepilin-type N-terminal cleavage/methylation domain-containing protein [Picosynechococcus sp. OG1]SMQ83694.1 prepilin-type N-terminal cleavage/methylation domain-containing protein [Synechococcus sp. 7002]